MYYYFWNMELDEMIEELGVRKQIPLLEPEQETHLENGRLGYSKKKNPNELTLELQVLVTAVFRKDYIVINIPKFIWVVQSRVCSFFIIYLNTF